jgi:hypothetical protein
LCEDDAGLAIEPRREMTKPKERFSAFDAKRDF